MIAAVCFQTLFSNYVFKFAFIVLLIKTGSPSYLGRLPSLCGSQCVGHNVWVTMCGSQCVGHNVWVTMCGSQCVSHIMWVALCGSHYVDRIMWVALCGSHCVCHITCVIMFVKFDNSVKLVNSPTFQGWPIVTSTVWFMTVPLAKIEILVSVEAYSCSQTGQKTKIYQKNIKKINGVRIRQVYFSVFIEF